MDINDLSINDWVSHSFGYCQVEGIASGHYEHKVSVRLFADDFPYLVTDADKLEPIQITEDALILNGFIKKYEGHYVLNIGNVNLSQEDADEFEVVWDEGDKLNIFQTTRRNKRLHGTITVDIKVKYVHELQRALRCGGLADVANGWKMVDNPNNDAYGH